MYLEDLSVGMSKTLASTTIDKDDMLAFAKKYDNVPLHTDEEYAKTTRFGKLIAPGVMSFMLVWAKYLEEDYFGEELIAGTCTNIQWFKPTFAGDTLTGVVTVTEAANFTATNMDILELNAGTVTAVAQDRLFVHDITAGNGLFNFIFMDLFLIVNFHDNLNKLSKHIYTMYFTLKSIWCCYIISNIWKTSVNLFVCILFML